MIRTFLAAGLLAGTLPAPAHAAVMSRDWKTPGDGLLTYDDVNKREWLDLSHTALSSQFPGADASPYVTRENRYHFVVGETYPEGLFAGFTVAKSADVVALAGSAGIDVSVTGTLNETAALALANLLSFTVESDGEGVLAIGLLDEPPSDRNPFPLIRPAAEIGRFGLGISEGHFQYPTPPGVMLYRNVPEPSVFTLMLLALIGTVRTRVHFPRRER
ncbi:MAG: hypothetical protein IT424_01215 [Pirellulales bacterium]|nr:hypothetical protein [Pirellulales bacterium]